MDAISDCGESYDCAPLNGTVLEAGKVGVGVLWADGNPAVLGDPCAVSCMPPCCLNCCTGD